jgi:hypothetical protein
VVVFGSILSALVATSFLGLGAGSFAAPRALSENYGIPVDGEAGFAYVRALGARDAILGLIVAAFLIGRDRESLGTTLALCALVGAADFAIVATTRGTKAPASLAIHGTGALGLLAVSSLVRAGR